MQRRLELIRLLIRLPILITFQCLRVNHPGSTRTAYHPSSFLLPTRPPSSSSYTIGRRPPTLAVPCILLSSLRARSLAIGVCDTVTEQTQRLSELTDTGASPFCFQAEPPLNPHPRQAGSSCLVFLLPRTHSSLNPHPYPYPHPPWPRKKLPPRPPGRGPRELAM